jgi:hypothetical protein
MTSFHVAGIAAALATACTHGRPIAYTVPHTGMMVSASCRTLTNALPAASRPPTALMPMRLFEYGHSAGFST